MKLLTIEGKNQKQSNPRKQGKVLVSVPDDHDMNAVLDRASSFVRDPTVIKKVDVGGTDFLLYRPHAS